MTLRDHFREKAMNPDMTSQDRLDDWALQYIDLNWLNPIMDAFDDDGTGFITIGEINRFTDDMPESLQWSLQHWIAYWAVGQYFVPFETIYLHHVLANRLADCHFRVHRSDIPHL